MRVQISFRDREINRMKSVHSRLSDGNGSRNSEACSSGRYYVFSRARNQCPELLCNLQTAISSLVVCSVCVYVMWLYCSKYYYYLYGRLSIVLVRANARAILARSLQVAGIQVDAMDY